METSRTVASAIMWITYLAIVALSVQTMGVWVILLAFVLMMPLLGAMGIMWNKENISVKTSSKGFILETEAEEKRKAIPIDSILKAHDKDDIRRLREYLLYGTIEDEIFYDYIVNDENLLKEER